MKILVVEDDPNDLKWLRRHVDVLGLDHTAVHCADKALECASTGAYQVVIANWEMEGSDGSALCSNIRDMGLPSYVYFLLTTIRDRDASLVEALDAGVDDLLSKPLDSRMLTARLHAAERVLALQSRDLTIFALAKLAESRDPETGAHLDRVRNYAQCIAEYLRQTDAFRKQIDLSFVRLIYETAPLHDIGKVAIPDHVLLKPGKLTPDEMEIMKRHTLVGADTLSAALAQRPGTPYLQIAREIARSHHERWDGKGYPDGLAANAIPLAARIVSVADVYDALTSARPYKPSYEHQYARQVIVEGSGTQFDPRVVNAFLAVETQILDIRARNQEQPPILDAA